VCTRFSRIGISLSTTGTRTGSRSIFHRGWHVQFAAFLTANDVQNGGWRGMDGKSEVGAPFFSCKLLVRSLARAYLPRTWWGINDTCQRANTERRPIPDHVQLRKAGPILCLRPVAREEIHALMPSPISHANVRPSARVVRESQ